MHVCIYACIYNTYKCIHIGACVDMYIYIYTHKYVYINAYVELKIFV